ncbi:MULTISPECIES: methylated-DNA--[protein]-cysteine S-methyltransferase [Basfia]|uniref:Methylated-DNA--protein-cysteine methyltransferase n=2 Tax=Basfia TaxID=697331 RepID=Q65UW6_MANSM|nr:MULTISPECIES: methylated-DNA--[protein]-cysteine S-methyltransferase [Basfia]AAU37244.1 Ada protein [[Mannheimia] succiniciproducens MBEL55E]QIM68085.1 cysteine methyltransferase [Basfia succiniciproducens]SCX87730.1 methylated-DNA-[protein]-cysteine S-methyltransferase [Basfia succiniciproducens]
MDSIYYSYYSSPVGNLLMIAQQGKLTNLDCELEQTAPNPKWILNNELPLFRQVKSALDRYFSGEKEDFSDIPLNPQGTTFQQSIWQALRRIQLGKTTSYGELARLINNPKAVRAVGGAVGSNPISIIIPCHRVLGKNGQLTGFGGGLPMKRFLLNLEKIRYVDKGVEYVKQKLLKKYTA